MSKLERLIQELCPEGVIKKKLISVCLKVENISWDKTSGTYKYIDLSSVDIETKTITATDEINASNAPSRARQVVAVNDVLFGTTRPTLNRYSFITSEYDGQICSTGFCVLRADASKALPRFLYHTISSSVFRLYVESKQRGTAYPSISDSDVMEYSLPLPPLQVQREIVQILDNFTELTARQKQYEYYLWQLLTPDSNTTPYITIGEIGNVLMCKRIMKAETTSDGEVPFFKIGTFGKEPDAFISKELFENYKKRYPYPKTGDVLISAAGTIGRTVIFDGNPAYYQDSNIVWVENDESKILNKYLYYCYQLEPWTASIGGTIARLYNDDLRKARIPMPPLTEQARIVKILDRFDALCNDLSSGLPAEIEARRKQYEYYRDKLLTFKEKVS